MNVCFIFNPKAGNHARNARMLDRLIATAAPEGIQIEIRRTERPGHATELARQASKENCAIAVAVGGDGTVNEVAQGLLGTDTALGLVPCGSGNGLALHLGIPTSADRAVALLLDPTSRRRRIDSGTANGRPFFNVFGLGLDAEVSRRFAGLAKRGLPAYLRETWAALRTHRPEPLRIECAGSMTQHTLSILSIANSDQWGNNAKIAPGAKVDDGLLDLISIRPLSLAQLPVLGARLFLGNLDCSRLVGRSAGTRFIIERTAPGWIHVDGEPFLESSRIEVLIRPASLSVVVPGNRSADSESSPAARPLSP